MKQGPAAKRRRLSSDQEEQVIGLYLLVGQLQIPVDGGGGKDPLDSAYVSTCVQIPTSG